jgi:hypothetical protein
MSRLVIVTYGEAIHLACNIRFATYATGKPKLIMCMPRLNVTNRKDNGGLAAIAESGITANVVSKNAPTPTASAPANVERLLEGVILSHIT